MMVVKECIKRIIPDKFYILLKYKKMMGKKININNPKSFNEKLQWLKLYDRNPLYTKMVDKYEAKKYVEGIIGKEYIIPTYGVWNRFEDIDFNILPNQFVLKCTHDSGSLLIVKNKEVLDRKEAKTKIEKCLKTNFYSISREWPYKNVVPRIIAEPLIKNKCNIPIEDYKLMCFNGKVKCSFVCTDRFSKDGLKVTFYDREWNRMPFERHYPSSKEDIPKPKNYEKMVELAEKLARDISFVRVDFYNVDGRIYFGEMTFYPGSGFEEFNPEQYDRILGDWLELPKR